MCSLGAAAAVLVRSASAQLLFPLGQYAVATRALLLNNRPILARNPESSSLPFPASRGQAHGRLPSHRLPVSTPIPTTPSVPMHSCHYAKTRNISCGRSPFNCAYVKQSAYFGASAAPAPAAGAACTMRGGQREGEPRLAWRAEVTLRDRWDIQDTEVNTTTGVSSNAPLIA